MYNDLLTIGNFTIHGYGLMIGIGIIAAYLMTEHLAKKKGLDPDPVFSLLVFGVLGGIVGAKLLYYITVFDEIIKDPSILLNVADGFVVYGGIIGGIAAGYGVCRVKKLIFGNIWIVRHHRLPLRRALAGLAAFLPAAATEWKQRAGVRLPLQIHSLRPMGPLVPTQIFSSVFDFAHFVVLYFISRRSKVDGLTSALYLIIYGVGRFIIEFFRGDLIRGSVGALSTSQFISIFYCCLWHIAFDKKAS